MKMLDRLPVIGIILLCCVSLYFVLPAYTRYRQTRMTLQQLQENFARQEMEVRELRDELTALRTDYRAIERVAREKFGLCLDGEKIYHFDAQPPLTGPEGASSTR